MERYKNVSTLMKLGFSPNQAKVYLALVKLGSASARNIWEKSGVRREEVYRKLGELQKLRVIELVVEKPAVFRASPLKSVIDKMLKHKAEEISDLQTETDELLLNLGEAKNWENLEADENKIILIPERKPLLERAKDELNSLENNLDSICSWSKGVGWLSNHYNLFIKALNRNVTIRFIIENVEALKLPRFIEKLKNNSLFQIRTIQAPPPACIGLYDHRKLLLDTCTKTAFVESPVLWSNNPSLIGMAQVFFDTIWKNSLE